MVINHILYLAVAAWLYILQVNLEVYIYSLILWKGLSMLLTAALERRAWAFLSTKERSLDLQMPIVFHM